MSVKTIASRILLCTHKSLNGNVNSYLNRNYSFNDCGRKFIWAFLNPIFNKYDEDRVKEVGPERACAEWLLKNGAAVRFERSDELLKDYNALPPIDVRPYIVEVDATESSISNAGDGFSYFNRTKKIQKIKLHKCDYVYDDALKHLFVLSKTLKDLQVSSCGNVSDDGIISLSKITSLQKLYIYDMIGVKDRQKCIAVIKESLPACQVNFPWAHESERPKTDDKKSK